MEPIKPTRTPTRDYQSFSGTPWPALDVMYRRRSHRKYLPVELDDAFVSGFNDITARACEVRGVEAANLLPVVGPGEVDAVRVGSYKGVTARMNSWLSRAPVVAFLVMAVDETEMRSQRPSELPRTSMACEDVVLWLTEQGMGTCWLGGVNARVVAAACGLAVGRTVPCVISIGKGALPAGPASYTGMAYRRMSRKRKQLSSIAGLETSADVYQPPALDGLSFEASGAGIGDLLAALAAPAAGKGAVEAPIDLAVDACLESARIAPSASNAQPWFFVAVRDRDRLGRLGQCCGLEDLAWRKGAIVALGQPKRWQQVMLDRPFWMIDVPIALSHITLLAASMGFTPELALDGIDEEGIAAAVAAPSGMRPVAVVGL